MAGRNLGDEVLGSGLWIVRVVEGKEEAPDLGSSTSGMSHLVAKPNGRAPYTKQERTMEGRVRISLPACSQPHWALTPPSA